MAIKAKSTTKKEDKKKSSPFQRFTRSLLLIIVGVLLVAVAGFYFYATFTYSEGTRNGTVIKISKKGNFFKTYEGQLNLGAYVNNNNNNSTPTSIWEFSVPKGNQQVLDDIDNSVDNGKRVKLHYKEKLVALPWQGDTKYLIYRVEILE